MTRSSGSGQELLARLPAVGLEQQEGAAAGSAGAASIEADSSVKEEAMLLQLAEMGFSDGSANKELLEELNFDMKAAIERAQILTLEAGMDEKPKDWAGGEEECGAAGAEGDKLLKEEQDGCLVLKCKKQKKKKKKKGSEAAGAEEKAQQAQEEKAQEEKEEKAQEEKAKEDGAALVEEKQEDGVQAAADECCVCLDAPRHFMFAPCGHRCACETCAKDVMRTTKECPMCRAVASKIFKGFL